MRRWMAVVGAIYFLLGVGFLPPINEARMTAAFDFAEAGQGTQLFKAFIDYSFAFGQTLLVTGGVLLFASRRPVASASPAEFRWLVGLVVLLETVHVFGDIYALQRGYGTTANMVWLGFIALHLAIAVTGVRVLRQAGRVAGLAPVEA